MKTLYLECNMGAAGDMLMAALLELHQAPEEFLLRLNAVGIPGVTAAAEASVKCGIQGTHMHIEINGQEEGHIHHHIHGHDPSERQSGQPHDDHAHGHDPSGRQSGQPHDHHAEHSHGSSLHTIEHLFSHLRISEHVRKNALAVYRLIAQAESHVHGQPVSQIHFHEVGEMDAVADIIGVCMLMEELGAEQILASPVHVGSGSVRCAHGLLPVPAPATAYILQNIPIYSDAVQGELCTPTGAALLKHFVQAFCKMPVMQVSGIGYGMGKKDFERANCLRAYLGDTAHKQEEVVELVCNLDDMTPEAVAFAQQILLEEGALDVYTAPIGMKKGRMGISFTCMCRTEEKEKMLRLLFRHTTSLGIREYVSRRHVLPREEGERETKYGPVRVKTAHGGGVERSKPEYEDVARIARENKISIQEVVRELS